VEDDDPLVEDNENRNLVKKKREKREKTMNIIESKMMMSLLQSSIYSTDRI
jgi:hypothetical protein